MFIINKKMLTFIVIIIFIIMLSYEIICLKKAKSFKISNTIETIATPVTTKVIVLDAGHGLPDNGGTSASGTSEEKINLQIILKLQKLLESAGCVTILTRSDENGIYDIKQKTIRTKKVDDMKKRVEITNKSDANVVVSIHLNKGDNSAYKGFQVFYKDEEESRKLGKKVEESLKRNVENNSRKSQIIKNKYLIDNCNIPIIIVECGFLSNIEDENRLKTDEYQYKIAWGIYIGLNDYFLENKENQ